ncbi:MAG: hypothetical protein RMZ42_17610, partial [Nostoc sp. DedQUE05]|uniref:hypothetical protein n=1 Tax=Nostoc sp. DedQUE05 TaxID=3075391 RepID=UPI002AD57E32
VQTFVQKVQTFVQKVQTFIQKVQTFILEQNLLDARVSYPIGHNHSQQKISLYLVPHTQYFDSFRLRSRQVAQYKYPIPSPLYLRSQTNLT